MLEDDLKVEEKPVQNPKKDQPKAIQQKPKRKPKADPIRTPTNTVPPPTLNVHAQFSMKVLKTQAITPMPNYKSMLDEELNVKIPIFSLSLFVCLGSFG